MTRSAVSKFEWVVAVAEVVAVVRIGVVVITASKNQAELAEIVGSVVVVISPQGNNAEVKLLLTAAIAVAYHHSPGMIY